jgi:hypothetical protein
MGEEFFRASFTTGIWAQGKITDGLFYKVMLGNNLSQLGIDAGQLDDGFDTFSGNIWWTTNDFGRVAPFGDYEKHQEIATMVGVGFTRSNETRQSQAGTEDPENSQIRLSDGTVIFRRGALAEGVQIDAAKYEMTSITGSAKYNGFSIDAEFYFRWVSKLEADGELPADDLFDHGFKMQTSAMVVDKTLQWYGFGSKIFGEYGDPWEVGTGLNWFVFKNRIFRFNLEYLYVENSPVGYLSYPTQVGANGPVFMLNAEYRF